MGEINDFTASNIHLDQDAREEAENRKKSQIDIEKLRADVAANKELAAQGKLDQALEGLLNLEKMTRLGEDITASRETCNAILQVCFDARKWKLLEEQVVLLAKRRGQLKHAVQSFVRLAMTFLPFTPDKETKVSLIKTLQTVTEGKIFVEIERARLTRKLAAMKEEEGNISEAADILQEVAVETFGAMAKTEKIAFILEQVRLCLDKKDFIRAQILSRKISPKAFVERRGEGKGEIGIEGTAIEAAEEGIPDLPELKHRYYSLMIRYHLNEQNYLETCRCYKAIYETEAVQADPAQWQAVLKKIVWYVVLSPAFSTSLGTSSDQLTLLTNTAADKKLSELPTYKALLQTFSTKEIVHWSTFQAQYGEEMAAEVEVFGPGEDCARRRTDLKLRVVQHNVLVVAAYYTRIRVQRLAQLLDLTPDEAEKHMSDLVVAKALSAKVDRPAGVVTFGQRKAPDAVLNVWSQNIGKLLELVEKSTQQIQKEAMVHKVQLGATA